MDDCAWAHSTERGIPPELCRRLNRGMAVWRTQVHYLGSAYEGDHIEVATWPVLNDERLRIERRFQIRRKSDGQTLVRALIHYVCIDLQTGKAKRMPPEFTKYTVAPEVAEAIALGRPSRTSRASSRAEPSTTSDAGASTMHDKWSGAGTRFAARQGEPHAPRHAGDRRWRSALRRPRCPCAPTP